MTKRRSDSLWWARYVGDYQRKTAHLSLAEHGAYVLLLDHYYATGKPLPANASRLQTICRAFAEQDVAAMHAVLNEFFLRDGDVFRNLRADEELLKRCDISEKRREAARAKHANAGANAPTNAGANGYAKRDTTTATSTTTSITRSQARGTRLPDDWSLPLDWAEWTTAQGCRLDLVPRMAAKFADYWQSKPGKTAYKLDWFKTWKNWVRTEMERLPAKSLLSPLDASRRSIG